VLSFFGVSPSVLGSTTIISGTPGFSSAMDISFIGREDNISMGMCASEIWAKKHIVIPGFTHVDGIFKDFLKWTRLVPIKYHEDIILQPVWHLGHRNGSTYIRGPEGQVLYGGQVTKEPVIQLQPKSMLESEPMERLRERMQRKEKMLMKLEPVVTRYKESTILEAPITFSSGEGVHIDDNRTYPNVNAGLDEAWNWYKSQRKQIKWKLLLTVKENMVLEAMKQRDVKLEIALAHYSVPAKGQILKDLQRLFQASKVSTIPTSMAKNVVKKGKTITPAYVISRTKIKKNKIKLKKDMEFDEENLYYGEKEESTYETLGILTDDMSGTINLFTVEEDLGLYGENVLYYSQ